MLPYEGAAPRLTHLLSRWLKRCVLRPLIVLHGGHAVHDVLLSGGQLLYRRGEVIRRCPSVYYSRVGLHLEPGAAEACICEWRGDPRAPRWEGTICARLREGDTPDIDETLALVGRVHAGE